MQHSPNILTLSAPEKGQLNDAIVALSQAKNAGTEETFLTAVQAAYKLTRQLVRGRLD
jgi:hypothetical protein